MDEEQQPKPFAYYVLCTLQFIAMGLVIFVLQEMAQNARTIPPQMCVELPPVQGTAND